MEYKPKEMFPEFMKNLKAISPSDFKWKVIPNEGALTCKIPTPTGNTDPLVELMHHLQLKMMPNEYTREDDGKHITYTFITKRLIDQINTLNANRVLRRMHDMQVTNHSVKSPRR